MADNRKRIYIESIHPIVDCGKFAVKREENDLLVVTADIFRDGHQKILARLEFKHQSEKDYIAKPMTCTNEGLDTWEGSFIAVKGGFYDYRIAAYCDDYTTWILDTEKKVKANAEYSSDVLEGIALAENHLAWISDKEEKKFVKDSIEKAKKASDFYEKWEIMSSERMEEIMFANPDPVTRVESETYKLRVDRQRARFSSWYEIFPRSAAFKEGEHGTFQDVIKRLPHIAGMGFDVLYFTPIHPVGHTKKKGPNNSLIASESDPGCPYSIGSEHGGHYSIEPKLGTMKDFEELINEASKFGIELAMDFALNCSPDHPYLKEHPDWFAHRPDGTIKYAENPPKKYEDIYPLDFNSPKYQEIYDEVLNIFLFWAEKGVRIFRVDNPHTKPFEFWRWLIAEVHKKYDDVIFLAEAFTRPKVMKALAKLGFTQSYTYFTWRNTKEELTEYFTELTTEPVSDYYRPNIFANTPDIFPYFLQSGKRSAYMIRAVLATTIATSYGIFQGFELCEGIPIPGKEEYMDSDKYEIRFRDWNAEGNIIPLITKLNKLRRANPALQGFENLRFHEIDNDQIIFYSKTFKNNKILILVNLDPDNMQSGFAEVPLELLGIDENSEYQVTDLLTDQTFTWHGRRNYVQLDPHSMPAHILSIKAL